MKFVDEYRDAQRVQKVAAEIAAITTRPWSIMEICGGQTNAIVKFGIDTLLPPEITLIHGPGCPVCVTAAEIIDAAIALASLPNVIFCSFGDMLRVPGSGVRGQGSGIGDQGSGVREGRRDGEVVSSSPSPAPLPPCPPAPSSSPSPHLPISPSPSSSPADLLSVKASGGDVRMVYSPLDAVKIAQANPDKQVVFFAVGFETTAPATAMAVYQAKQQGIHNFSLLVSHVLVPPAMEAILSSPHCRVQGFLAAGHVCTVMGYREYEAIAPKYHVPIVVTGFEPLDVMQGIYLCIKQLETGQAEVENQYARSVRQQGNEAAQALIQSVFEVVPQQWRGIGEIPQSGLGLRAEYAEFDVWQKGLLTDAIAPAPAPMNECISGLILQGIQKPHNCPAFGTHCTPEQPLGAPMVSSEGACAAYYRYRQR